MSVTLVPIRLLGLSLSLVTAWIFASIALCGRTKEDEKQPLSGWRRLLQWPVQAAAKAIMFCLGFHRIRRIGRRATAKEAPVLVCAPHSTYMDAVVITVTNGIPSAVARNESRNTPFLGKLTKFTQPVFVSREDPNSRQNTIKEIRQRAQTKGDWPQIIIFPEGTCTNRKCLITFKPGAFFPGVPVQPVCIRYPNHLDTFTWTWEGPTAFQVFWYTMCQLHNRIEIEFLPVYTPTEEERNDPKLFGENVRAVMAKALRVPVTDHTYEEIRLMNFAGPLEMPVASDLVGFNKLNKKLRLNIKEQLSDLLLKCQNGSIDVTLEEFAAIFDVPVSPHIEELFNFMDHDGSGKIDFREYLLCLHLVTEPSDREETIKFAFKLFDAGSKGHLTQEELRALLCIAYGIEEGGKAFSEADVNHTGSVSYDDWRSYAFEKAEFRRLFTEQPESMVFDTKLLSNGLTIPWSQEENREKIA